MTCPVSWVRFVASGAQCPRHLGRYSAPEFALAAASMTVSRQSPKVQTRTAVVMPIGEKGSALAGTNGCVSPDHPLRPRTDPRDSSLADKAACRPNRLLSLAGVDVAMGCTGETTSGSQASEESARPCVIAKEHIVMSRRLISPDASATISGDVAAG